jgi:hypothetical protein
MNSLIRSGSILTTYSIIIFAFIMCENTENKKGTGDTSVAAESDTLRKQSKVEIIQQEHGFQLMRNGAPYYIKGVAGEQQMEAAVASGANSIRIYAADNLDTLLNRAHSLGLSVMVGIWLGREIEGFDYDDVVAVAEQKEMVKAIVNQYKDHPAVLFWALGNELDNSTTHKRRLWTALNDLADVVHQLDPNHPVTTATTTKRYRDILRYCPQIDFLCINAFGNIAEFDKTSSKEFPFVYSEWGALGPWESEKTYWHAVLEQSIVQKYRHLQEQYASYIAGNTTTCMGSYVFYWGQKQEYTPTWFSFFTENGLRTPLVDAMAILWNGSHTENRAPFLDSLTLDGKGASKSLEIAIGGDHVASVRALDKDGDELKFTWEILPDGPFFKYAPGVGKVEIRPTPVEGLILEQTGNQIVFRSPPKTGPYRLLVYAFDGKGNGSYANMPFYMTNNSLVD